MFSGAFAFNPLTVAGWNAANMTNSTNIFHSATFMDLSSLLHWNLPTVPINIILQLDQDDGQDAIEEVIPQASIAVTTAGPNELNSVTTQENSAVYFPGLQFQPSTDDFNWFG